ncbi:MAG: phage holin family protein [Acidimicrobiia bacterium]|nr:phage holin family protein [Acidimicrobiia bacterium]MBT8214840.1 phage holin family protein [Acidimicrobiia bacterium]NNF68624.1 hypothetical protein [Acidimicrobiia bacterium]NNK91119.1 hypothetical protein [Acidimicrobiia bacterium]
MAGPTELPQMVQEFVGMSKEYLRQETVEPARRLGRYAGLGFAGAAAFALGALFLGIAAVRFIIELMPGTVSSEVVESHTLWSGLGYIAAALVLFAVIGAIIALVNRKDPTP